ncbi:MAG: hypothetical protein ACRYGM_08825, partial [Janthinobacterium lividum]
SKRHGSGIGAFQARELVREGGGDVQAISIQAGSMQALNMQAGGSWTTPGTTMRITLPRADGAESLTAQPPQLASMEGRA